MHPSISYELLSRIPRLEMVASMIAGQQGQSAGKVHRSHAIEPVELGAHMLRIAVEFDQLLLRGDSFDDAVRRMKNRPADYYPAAIAALESMSQESISYVTKEISIREISTGMILDEDLRTPDGNLMAARNQEISYPLLVRVRNMNQKSPIYRKIRVRISPGEEPAYQEAKEQTVTKSVR